jgi:hypothetical protein
MKTRPTTTLLILKPQPSGILMVKCGVLESATISALPSGAFKYRNAERPPRK